MVGVVCVGNVNAEAVFSTIDGKKVYVKHTIENVEWSDILILTIEFVCEEKNFIIASFNQSKNNTIYWNTTTAAGKDNGELLGWLDFHTTSVSSMMSSVNPGFLTGSNSLKAEYTIEDEGVSKLLQSCTEMRVFYYLISKNEWVVERTPLTDYTQISDSSSKNISSLSFSEISNKSYTGKAINPSVTVKDGSKKLVKGTDYTVTYKNNKNIGTATVTIKGKGDYTGSKTIEFKIVPAKTVLKAKKQSDTKVKLTWDKVKNAEKYQIYYSTNGGKYKKLATVSGSKTSYTNSKLDFKKNDYKFKIRAYDKVDGTTYYGSYSKAVTVK